MSSKQIILTSLLFAIWYLLPTVSVAIGKDSPAAASKDSAKAKSTPPESADSSGDQTNDNNRAVALQAIDQIIKIVERTGNSDNVAKWQSYRDQFPAGDEFDCTRDLAITSCKLASDLATRREWLSAKKFMPITLRLADAVKDRAPQVFMLANCLAAQLDIDFELYDSALKHISTALKVAEGDGIDRHDALACRVTYAYLLQKTKRFDESEKIRLDLVRQTKANPEGFSQIELFHLKFGLAELYAEKRQFTEYLKAIKDFPDGVGKQVDEDAADYAERWVVMDTVVVNCALASKNKLDVAEKHARAVDEFTQKCFGASSLQHIEAIELLAKVRVAQKREDEALVLLKKSAELRAGLLGEDHPSTSRVQNEIDAVRAKQLGNSEPIWTPPNNGDESKSEDRYGTAKPVGGTK